MGTGPSGGGSRNAGCGNGQRATSSNNGCPINFPQLQVSKRNRVYYGKTKFYRLHLTLPSYNQCFSLVTTPLVRQRRTERPQLGAAFIRACKPAPKS